MRPAARSLTSGLLQSGTLRSLTPAVILAVAFVILTGFVRHTPLTPRELSVDRSITARTPANLIDLSLAVNVQDWIFVVLALAVVLALLRRYRQALLLILAEVLAEGLNAALKIGVDRQPPDQAVMLTSVFQQLDTLLFPSGHVVRLSVTVCLLALFLAWPHARARLPAGLVALGCMALIGVTQVAVGGHLPLDALGGYLLAGVIVNVIYVVDRSLAAPVEARLTPRTWLAASGLAAALLLGALAVGGGVHIAHVPATAAGVVVDHLSHPRLMLTKLHDWIE
jgi:membrane-associated phospholipid phosphatase